VELPRRIAFSYLLVPVNGGTWLVSDNEAFEGMIAGKFDKECGGGGKKHVGKRPRGKEGQNTKGRGQNTTKKWGVSIFLDPPSSKRIMTSLNLITILPALEVHQQ
jgi:hypothetical protein